MPIIDRDRDLLVVRVVYDGPALSGKTTTLRALADGLGVDMATPAERDGRTLFFDWVDYVGGVFEGRQIRCQIVSVPGQKEWSDRREHLLQSADVVVMVANTEEEAIEEAMGHVRLLMNRCRQEDPPLGFVLQANKRDAPTSVPRESLQAMLNDIAPSAVFETVATTGEGIREAFVFGVRLALDRVRALARVGRLPEGMPVVDSADDLLEQLVAATKREVVSNPVEPVLDKKVQLEAEVTPESEPVSSSGAEEDALDHLVEQHAPHRRTVARVRNMADEIVFVPDPMMPGGFIWPPVDGRSLLYEVSQLGLTPRCTRRGDWWASDGAWRCHSAARALFDDADLGRQALIEWARLHATHLGLLSSGRALILVGAGDERFRLWQLVRSVETVHAQLLHGADVAGPLRLAEALIDGANLLLRARRSFHTSQLRLSCSLTTLAVDHQGHPVYVGLMPETPDAVLFELEGAALVEREMTPLMRLLSFERSDFVDVCGALKAIGGDGLAAATLSRLSEGREWA